MFEVGFTELLLIFALALIVLGPEKLPKLAQQVGRWVGRARAMARQFREQLEEEATNLERKLDVDPGIDMSLDAKPQPAASSQPVTPETPSMPAATAAPVPAPEEEFYPPDHHMHASNRDRQESHDSPGAAADEPSSGAQTELDLTASRDEPPRPAP